MPENDTQQLSSDRYFLIAIEFTPTAFSCQTTPRRVQAHPATRKNGKLPEVVETVKAGFVFDPSPISFFHLSSEHGHIKAPAYKQGGELAEPVKVFLVRHNLLHRCFHGRQILEILKPAYGPRLTKKVSYRRSGDYRILVGPRNHLPCPL